MGTHDELMKIPYTTDENGKPVCGPGLYHALWDTQQGKTTGAGAVSSEETLKIEIERLKKENEALRTANAARELLEKERATQAAEAAKKEAGSSFGARSGGLMRRTSSSWSEAGDHHYGMGMIHRS